MKYLPVVCDVFIVSIVALGVITSAFYIHYNFEKELQNCFYALFQTVNLSTGVYKWIVSFITCSKLVKIRERFQEIYDTSNIWMFLEHWINW